MQRCVSLQRVVMIYENMIVTGKVEGMDQNMWTTNLTLLILHKYKNFSLLPFGILQHGVCQKCTINLVVYCHHFQSPSEMILIIHQTTGRVILENSLPSWPVLWEPKLLHVKNECMHHTHMHAHTQIHAHVCICTSTHELLRS
jgi:hypothetical protein